MSFPVSNMEIERKFLISALPESISDAEHAMIVQTYLTKYGEPFERRIRKVVRGGVEAHFLTQKSGKGLSRQENEVRISRAEFIELAREAVTESIVKKRHFISLDGGLTAELDIYEGRLSGLMTVEVEFVSLDEATAFTPPDWFGIEITDDARYKNRSLAENGIPQS